MSDPFAWPVQAPFVQRHTVEKSDTDEFGHVNNLRYGQWAMDAAWAHTNALGLAFADYERLGVGCVVWRHEFDYLAPTFIDDEIAVATWIGEMDGRLRMQRCYEMRRAGDGALVFRGRTTFVSMDMKTGKPVRMPQEFVAAYAPAQPFEKET
ncbi:MAG: thioesterase family protein [Pseudomonadota bacterium]